MKKILFICPNQFGYHTGTYFTIKLIEPLYKITYIGFDEGYKKINIDNVRLLHIPRSGNSFTDKQKIIKLARKEIKESNFNFIFLIYFPLCSFIRVFTRIPINVDVRTSYIFKNPLRRFVSNFILSIEVRLFKHITTISDGLKKYLFLPYRTKILPLGAPRFPLISKDFSKINCLYVGTFYNRNIQNTIKGFAKFFSEFGKDIKMKYDIIGFGNPEEISLIQQTIKDCQISENVFFHGSVRYPELENYFRTSNVGISYIPLTKYYDYQPPTKTFEYLLSGMVVIATVTNENKMIITQENGIIIDDSVEDFYNGLVKFYKNMAKYDSVQIQKNAEKFTWENIIQNITIPLIESIIQIT